MASSSRRLITCTPPDSEWQELHKWWKEYKRRTGVTSAQFLVLCGEKPEPTWIQYLSRGGSARKVSAKEGTKGAQLRDILLRARDDPPEVTPEILSSLTPRDWIKDHNSYNSEELFRNGIQSVAWRGDPEPRIEVAVNDDCDVDKAVEHVKKGLSTIKLLSEVPIDTKKYSYLYYRSPM